MERLPAILTIAGSDSSGGAGIQADLKTIAMLGGYGASVLTALTAQNTLGVTAIHAPDPEFVTAQLRAVLEDVPLAAAKTGMLFSPGIIAAVAAALKDKPFQLVVDPVCVSQSGSRLLQPEAEAALIRDMLPLADLLTPNRDEAEVLTGLTVRTREDVFAAIDRLLSMGPRAVLLKGGHFDSDPVTDWLGLPGREPVPFRTPRVQTPNNHGTGCTLAAAIATFLGRGLPLHQAVGQAQAYLSLCLRASFPVGRGSGPVNHSAPLLKAEARSEVLEELRQAANRMRLMEGLFRLMPEARMNLALALPWPDGPDEVAAFPGRITAVGREIVVPRDPSFGASGRMAPVVLAAGRLAPELRSAANIRYGNDVLGAVRRAGLTIARFYPAAEPQDRDGSSLDRGLEWGTLAALKEFDDPAQVDAVVDSGDIGKEAMIRILGRDSRDVLDKIGRILSEL